MAVFYSPVCELALRLGNLQVLVIHLGENTWVR